MMETVLLERVSQPTLSLGVWRPERARGAILVTPGYAESIARWEQVASRWSTAGFSVAVYDLRGQGNSQGRRGHVDQFGDFTGDLFAVLEHLTSRFGWSELGPPIGFGHSLGGLITTVAALDRPHLFRALGLNSPFWGLALKPAAWKVWAGRKLTNVWPTYSEATELPLELLTHDQAKVEMMRADPLRITRVTARWFTETEAARQRVANEFSRLAIPVFALAAGEDHVADVGVTRRIFAASTNPGHVLEVVPGEYHELHQELNRQLHIDRYLQQFERWCPSPA